MKVMTFNMRVANPGDGKNSFWERKPRILKMLENETPDLIGVQEATDEMKDFLRENLKGYTVVGCGRTKNYTGESVALAIKNDCFELVSLEHFWLSETPKIPGTRYIGDQSPCPRISLAAKLACAGNGELINVVVTHLDHCGQVARRLGMAQNIQYISENSEKFIFMGDFNATPDSPEIMMFEQVMSYRGGVDITKELGDTFHAFGQGETCKIDYIFTDMNCKDCQKVEDEGEKTGLYYSDHKAIVAELELN